MFDNELTIPRFRVPKPVGYKEYEYNAEPGRLQLDILKEVAREMLMNPEWENKGLVAFGLFGSLSQFSSLKDRNRATKSSDIDLLIFCQGVNQGYDIRDYLRGEILQKLKTSLKNDCQKEWKGYVDDFLLIDVEHIDFIVNRMQEVYEFAKDKYKALQEYSGHSLDLEFLSYFFSLAIGVKLIRYRVYLLKVLEQKAFGEFVWRKILQHIDFTENVYRRTCIEKHSYCLKMTIAQGLESCRRHSPKEYKKGLQLWDEYNKTVI